MVERDGFEIRCTRKGTQGSNPWLSASQIIKALFLQGFLCLLFSVDTLVDTLACCWRYCSILQRIGSRRSLAGLAYANG